MGEISPQLTDGNALLAEGQLTIYLWSRHGLAVHRAVHQTMRRSQGTETAATAKGSYRVGPADDSRTAAYLPLRTPSRWSVAGLEGGILPPPRSGPGQPEAPYERMSLAEILRPRGEANCFRLGSRPRNASGFGQHPFTIIYLCWEGKRAARMSCSNLAATCTVNSELS